MDLFAKAASKIFKKREVRKPLPNITWQVSHRVKQITEEFSQWVDSNTGTKVTLISVEESTREIFLSFGGEKVVLLFPVEVEKNSKGGDHEPEPYKLDSESPWVKVSKSIYLDDVTSGIKRISFTKSRSYFFGNSFRVVLDYIKLQIIEKKQIDQQHKGNDSLR